MTSAAPAPSLAARLAQAGGDADWRDVARAALGEHRQVLTEAFAAGEAVERLIGRRCALIDAIVTMAWQRCIGDAEAVALLATGGYGRGELYPFSDVDLLVLAEPRVQKKLEPALARFFALLWDAGLATSHAVRSVEQWPINVFEECLDQGESGSYTARIGLNPSSVLEAVWASRFVNRNGGGVNNIRGAFRLRVPAKIKGYSS